MTGGECNTALLGANVSPSPNSALVSNDLKPYSIVEVGGASYAIIGLDVAIKTMSSSAPDPGTFLFNEAATAQAYINILEEQGHDKIILLTHQGYFQDIDLAAMLRGVDIIVGGDSHTLLGDEQLAELLASTPIGPYPTQAVDKDGNQVCIVQAWEYGHILGELDVKFDCNGAVLSCTGSPRVPIDAGSIAALDGGGESVRNYLDGFESAWVLEGDPGMREVFQVFEDEVGPRQAEVVGFATENLCFERIPGTGW
jgi:5'-nucleotidase